MCYYYGHYLHMTFVFALLTLIIFLLITWALWFGYRGDIRDKDLGISNLETSNVINNKKIRELETDTEQVQEFDFGDFDDEEEMPVY